MSAGLRPRSVRMRLTLWYAGALAAGLAVYAIIVFILFARALSSEINHQINEDIEFADNILELEGGRLRLDEDIERGEEPRIEVRDLVGNILYRSPRFKNIDPSEYRVLSRQEKIKGVPVVISAAESTEHFHHQLGKLGLIFGLGVPAVVLLAGAGGYALAWRALAPVGRMTRRAQAITAENLSERLPVENGDDELGRLAMVFNSVFARLERSFEQLRRFTADASHELRTPLTALRSVGEVGLAERRTAEEYREIIGSMLEEADRLARLVDSLLTISRADGGQVKLHRQDEDLAALAREVAQQLGILAEEKRQALEVAAPEPVWASVDPLVVRQALLNLVDNAIKYSPEGAKVCIFVRSVAEGAELEVSDNGPGIAPEHQARIFDRFYRIDTGRSRQMGGVGLGLAITRWAAEAHGGRVELHSEAGVGSTFRLMLPEPAGQ